MAAEAAFAADEAGLAAVLAYLDRGLAELGASASAGHKLRLIAEELFLNTVQHGGGAAGPVHMSLSRGQPRELVFVYVDRGPAFDPLQARDEHRHQPLAARPVGGLGLSLLRGFAAAARYERRDGCNQLTLTLHELPGEPPHE